MSKLESKSGRAKSGRAWRAVAMGVLVAVSASVGLAAWAQPMHGHGHAEHAGAGMGPHLFAGSPERLSRGVDHMLDGLNASDAQRSQIKQIVLAAAAELKGQHEAGRALRDKAAAVFTAPTVDAAAAESLRQQMITQHDTASRRVLQAMLDISNVLTPEQRSKMGQRLKERQQRMQERRQRMEQRQAPSK